MRFCGSVVSGFTIVELLIVGTVVFVLLGGMTVVLGNVSQQIWTRTEPRLTALTEAQRALDRVSEDLRTARQANLTCRTAAAGVCTAPPCLEFDPICPTPPCPARVTYMRDGTNLLRLQGAVTQVVTAGLTAFTPACNFSGITGLTQLQITATLTTPQGSSAQTFDSNVWARSP